MAFSTGTTRDTGYCLLWMRRLTNIGNMSKGLDDFEYSEEVEIGK